MKAILCTRYGPPEVLRLQDVDNPVPGANDVLIKIRAAAVTPSDRYIRRGTPTATFAMRIMIPTRQSDTHDPERQEHEWR